MSSGARGRRGSKAIGSRGWPLESLSKEENDMEIGGMKSTAFSDSRPRNDSSEPIVGTEQSGILRTVGVEVHEEDNFTGKAM